MLPLLYLSIAFLPVVGDDPGLTRQVMPPFAASSQNAQAKQPSSVQFGKVEAPGIHNVFQITAALFSGSSPEVEEGFRSLQKLGIKTVISVDGARPDVVTAHKY